MTGPGQCKTWLYYFSIYWIPFSITLDDLLPSCFPSYCLSPRWATVWIAHVVNLRECVATDFSPPLKSWIIWEMQRVSFQMSCVPKRCFPWQLTASVQPASNGPGFWRTNCRPLKTWSSVSSGSGYTAKWQIRMLREPQCKSLSPTSLSILSVILMYSYVFLLIFLSWRVSFFTEWSVQRHCGSAFSSWSSHPFGACGSGSDGSEHLNL